MSERNGSKPVVVRFSARDLTFESFYWTILEYILEQYCISVHRSDTIFISHRDSGMDRCGHLSQKIRIFYSNPITITLFSFHVIWTKSCNRNKWKAKDDHQVYFILLSCENTDFRHFSNINNFIMIKKLTLRKWCDWLPLREWRPERSTTSLNNVNNIDQ